MEGTVNEPFTEEPLSEEPHPDIQATGIRRLINATRFSWQGFRAAYRSEEAVRQESFLIIFGTPLALWLGETAMDKIALVGSLVLILVIELLNTAVETTIDRISHEIHELSGKAKDIGSAAVLITILLTIFIWGMIIYERFIA
mgnify:CR=1 FL=1